ncbi:MAG: NAD(P)-binding domain-containing protein [Gammaproteobacteria bacterium]|nr:NAD(P)-binding domain-containing protein [Gammaproteobacteria bacterium]
MLSRRSLTAIALCLFTLSGVPAFADTIAIIGTGDVGSALGPRFAEQGHTIVYGSRDPGRSSVNELVARSGEGASATTQADAAAQASIVVLAIPGMLVEEITRSLGDLSGKIIIDPTNPLQRSSLGLVHAAETSNAEIIQAAAPDAFVVKAFNTLNYKTMIDPGSADGPVSIPLAGDDAAAKKVVAELVAGMGLEPIDVGPLENAHWVEGMLILWINNRYGTREAFDFHLRKTR